MITIIYELYTLYIELDFNFKLDLFKRYYFICIQNFNFIFLHNFFIFKIDNFFINFFYFLFLFVQFMCATHHHAWLNHMHHLLSKHDQASQDPPYLRPHFTWRTLSKLFFISLGDKVRICFLQWWSKEGRMRGREAL